MIFKLSLIASLLVLSSCGSVPAHSGAPHEASAHGPGTRKSIGGWVSCRGNSDDTAGVAKAFEAARHRAFTLVVDCPVNIKVGMDMSRTLFIDDGTAVEFTGAGKFTVDNVFIPAFVIADSDDITLTNWNVEYDASLPVNEQIGGHVNEGIFVRGPKSANAFNDLRLTHWLAANRAIVFDKRKGNVNAQWGGVTNPCAVIYITGDSSNLKVTGMRMYVPPNVGGERLIPVAFALGANFKRNQTVTADMPMTGEYFAIPHDIVFSNIELDGTYMGWVGGLRNALFENIQSRRYGDLQDAQGGTVGGVGKWFAPPHLFYFSYAPGGDAALFNTNIRIKNVRDSGLRIGRARDAGGTDTLSGYALSLKLGCVNCSVDGYASARPDGFLDVLTSDGLTISNVTATYDSAFLNNLFPGWRFPSSTYKNVTFDKISLSDTAATSVQLPIGNANQASNENLNLENIHVELNRWSGQGRLPLPNIAGRGNHVSLDYVIKDDAARVVKSQSGSLEITLEAVPARLPLGTATVLTWATRQAEVCSASGAWSGPVGTSGSRTLTLSTLGGYDFTLACKGGAATSQATLHVVVSAS